MLNYYYLFLNPVKPYNALIERKNSIPILTKV